MSTMTNTALAGHAAGARLAMAGAAVKRWWGAHLARRVERAAIAQLASMSDRELHDIGLARSQIEAAVRGVDLARGRAMTLYF